MVYLVYELFNGGLEEKMGINSLFRNLIEEWTTVALKPFKCDIRVET